MTDLYSAYDTYGRANLKKIIAVHSIKIALVFIPAIFPFFIPTLYSALGIEPTEYLFSPGEIWPVKLLQDLAFSLRIETLISIGAWALVVIAALLISTFMIFSHSWELEILRQNDSPDGLKKMLARHARADKVEDKLRALFQFRCMLAATLFFDAFALLLIDNRGMAPAGALLGLLSLAIASRTNLFSALDVANSQLDHTARQRDENKRRNLDP